MSHEIDMSKGLAAFARREGTEGAWHGLGQTFLETDADEVIAQKAGLDYRILRSTVRYVTEAGGAAQLWTDQQVLFRTDNKTPLAVVGNGFKIHHQPSEALSHLRKRALKIGAQLDTAMALKGGSVIVATAQLPVDHAILGTSDKVRARINYASAFDGSMRTLEFFSNERIVCANTLAMALSEEGAGMVRTSHRSVHDNASVEAELGISAFVEQMKHADDMARAAISEAQTQSYFAKVYLNASDEDVENNVDINDQFRKLMNRLAPQLAGAPGAQLRTARGTVWGALNAVTHDIDHVGTSRNADNRAVSALFGKGAQIKARAWDQALALVA